MGSGVYVKLDAEYASNVRLIEAGPLAELLYVRGLAFCKRTMSDGVIRAAQLPVVALGLPGPKKLAGKLVEVGAWAELPSGASTGWCVAGWFEWNKPVAQIVDERDQKRRASMAANHAQHHVGPGKKPSPKCELCRAQDAHAEPDYAR